MIYPGSSIRSLIFSLEGNRPYLHFGAEPLRLAPLHSAGE